MKFLFLLIAPIFSIVGCSNNQDSQSSPVFEEQYDYVREIAWNFLNEKGWNDSAKEDWKTVKVTKVIVGNNYKLIDNSFKGEEVLAVSFEDKMDAIVGTPKILVDSDTSKVVGYMLGE